MMVMELVLLVTQTIGINNASQINESEGINTGEYIQTHGHLITVISQLNWP